MWNIMVPDDPTHLAPPFDMTPFEGTVTALTTPAPAPPAPAELLQQHIVAAVADTLHKIDVRAHLELLARTDPRTFRQWVEMALPRQGGKGNQQATIVNVHSALPKSPLDGLPPGFDIHR
jgi:hypothetical protein